MSHLDTSAGNATGCRLRLPSVHALGCGLRSHSTLICQTGPHSTHAHHQAVWVTKLSSYIACGNIPRSDDRIPAKAIAVHRLFHPLPIKTTFKMQLAKNNEPKFLSLFELMFGNHPLHASPILVVQPCAAHSISRSCAILLVHRQRQPQTSMAG